jgi:pimeloyl-ACP methyl ester carboxylesterase
VEGKASALRARGGATTVRAVALAVLLLGAACATPVGVKRVDEQRVHRDLTANVLSTGQPSAAAEQALHRDDLTGLFASDPAAALAELRARWLAAPGPRRLFALAELCFVHAGQGGGSPYYLAAAVYAYAYLFSGPPSEAPDPFDPRLRLAADLYNRGFTEGLQEPGSHHVDLSPRTLLLPFGQLALESDPASFLWVNHELEDFVPVADLEVRGLSSRYRRRGVGVPLAAKLGPIAPGREEDLHETWLAPKLRVPSTAVVRLDHVRQGIADGRVVGRVELYVGEAQEEVEIDGREVPLEYEPTAALAYSLEKSRIWDVEIPGLLGRDLDLEARSNLVMLAPHARGQTPVVLIHGTASSPGRWVEMINELGEDQRLRSHYEFWLFFYKTGNPILYSAMQLRQALRHAVDALDPSGTDAALRRMVLIGHSQGGLLAKLMAVDSGDAFWRNVSDVPPSELGLDPETAELVDSAFFFQALPEVRSVIFIATPHGGSFLAGRRVAGLFARLVSFPIDVVQAGVELLENDKARAARRDIAHMPNSLDNMTPGSAFLVALHALPLAQGIEGHSIVAVRSPGPLLGQGDGVVAYDSAHIEDVVSERVVISPHSGAQDHPDTIAEVRRILLELLASP